MLKAERAINRHVAQRIRERRKAMGLTQKQLAQRIGVSPQQMQRLECAERRLSVGALGLTARALRVPEQYFFCGIPARRG